MLNEKKLFLRKGPIYRLCGHILFEIDKQRYCIQDGQIE